MVSNDKLGCVDPTTNAPHNLSELLIYLRKSEMDRKDPDALARHERTLRRLARREGCTVGGVYVDADITASKDNVRRPGFERLLADLPASGGLLAMDLDRVTRASKTMERLIDVFESAPHLRFVVAEKERSPNLGTPEGRNQARGMVIKANDETLQTARRMRDMHEDLREQAEPHTGVPGFGMATAKKADPKQVKLIRDAARDVLAGMSVNAVAKAWREAGVKTPRGKEWTGSQMTTMLRSPRMAGYRVHHGDRYRREDTGEWAKCGPEILDEATWQAVVKELARRAEAKEPRRTRRTYVLSGFCACGVCAGPMSGNVWSDGVRYSYTCSNRGCVGIAGHRLDAYLEGVLLRRWAGADSLVVEQDGPDVPERERLEALNGNLMAAVSAGTLALDDVMGEVAKNRKAIDAIRAEERAHARQRARRDVAGANPVERWHALKAEGDIERMLVMVRQEMDHLVIQPAQGTGRRWDEDRVKIVWA